MRTTLWIIAIIASVVVIVLGLVYFLLKNQVGIFTFVDELRKRKENKANNKEEPRLSKSVNFLIMIGVNLLAVWIVQSIALQFFERSWFLTLVVCVATIPLLVTAGLVDIPIQHAGVPLVFGKRQKHWLLDEGLNWILPSPIMGVEIVDLREKTIPIPKDEKEEETKPLIIPAIRGLPPLARNGVAEPAIDEEAQKKIRFVQMKARLAIRYRVVHPYQFLSQGPDVVERGLGDLAIKTLRQKGSEMSDIQLIRQKDTFEEAIIEEMKTEPKDGKGESPIERWGVRVHNVFIPRIAHAEADMAKAYEAAMQEEQQRTAEEIEQKFLAESITQLVGKGLTPQEALYAIQSERGKLVRREVIITSTGGGSVGDIAKAVATYAGLLSEQPKTEQTNTENKKKGGN